MPFDYFVKNWTAHKGEGERLINDLIDENKVRPEIADFFKRELRLRMFNVLLTPVFAQQPGEPIRAFSKLYQDTVKMQAEILKQEFSLTTSRLLSYGLRNYAWYILLSRGQHLSYPLLYEAAKEEYRGLQLDRALYFIIKEADRENYNIGNLLRDFQTITSDHHSFFLQELKAIDRKNDYDLLADSLANDTLTDRSGAMAKLHDVIRENKGKIIFIDIWASWCGPCLLELPLSAQIQNEFVKEDFIVLFLSIDEDKERWKEAINLLIPEANNSYRFIGDRNNGLFQQLGIQGIPRYLILDREGWLQYSHAPSPGSERLKEILNALLQK